MLEIFKPGMSLSWDLLWQPFLFLAIGLAASLALGRRPARAHRVLVLAMAAALVTPALAQVIRVGGWGVLRPPTTPIAQREDAVPPTGDMMYADSDESRAAPGRSSG